MKLVKRGDYYYLRLRRGGVEEWISTHKTSKREGEKAAERILALFDREKQTRQLAKKLCEYALALARNEITQKDVQTPLAMLEKMATEEALKVIDDIFPAPPVTASDLWDTYMESNRNVKQSTISTKRQRWMTFQRWAGDKDMRTLNEIVCRKFLDSLNISSQTRKNYVSDLSSVFSANGGVANPWTANLRHGNQEQTTVEERKDISIEDVRAILAFCDTHPDKTAREIPYASWARFLRTLYYTGLRPVDVCHLKSEEIKDGIIELLPEKTSRTRRKVSYKADDKLLSVLATIEVGEDGMFFPEFAAQYDRNRSNLDPGFKRIVNNAGLGGRGITLYGFRHHYVTYQINSGQDDESVASAVGHASTETTNAHYYHGRKKVVLSELPEV